VGLKNYSTVCMRSRIELAPWKQGSKEARKPVSGVFKRGSMEVLKALLVLIGLEG
jgi:hypothetical protein